MSNIDQTIVSVTITDLTNDRVTSIAVLPDHLHEWSADAIAQWAVERDDIVFGRQVEIDHTVDDDYFGTNEWSYTLYYRAGARYQVAVTVVYVGHTYIVRFPDGDVMPFRTEEAAVTIAGSIDGSTLGTGSVVL